MLSKKPLRMVWARKEGTQRRAVASIAKQPAPCKGMTNPGFPELAGWRGCLSPWSLRAKVWEGRGGAEEDSKMKEWVRSAAEERERNGWCLRGYGILRRNMLPLYSHVLTCGKQCSG